MPIQYPSVARGEVVETLHGEKVADPYRWLEDTEAAATRAFIEAENALTEAYLERVETREEIRAELRALWNYDKHGVPTERGGHYFQWRQRGLENQPVLYVAERPGEEGRVLLDANLLSADGTVAVTDLVLRDDGAFIAYAMSVGGSDWRTWRIREVATGVDLSDVLEWSKFTGAAFGPGGGDLYYGVLDAPDPGAELLAKTETIRIARHRLGTDQNRDELIWAAPEEPEWLPEIDVSEDGRFLILSIVRGTRPENQLHLLDLTTSSTEFVAVSNDFSAHVELVANLGETLILLTDDGAERSRLVAVELGAPGRESWRELVAERSDTLLGAELCGGEVLAHYLHDVTSRLERFTPTGAALGAVGLPDGRVLSALSGRAHSPELFFSTTGFTDSGSVFSFDLNNGETVLIHPPGAALDEARYVTEQAFVATEDGARIPVFLTHRRDVTASGDVPTVLYGYGGFNILLLPRFSVAMAVFVERGGLFAVANLRGGGEYGRSWYDAGRLEHKQRVFDDFAACARHLVASGWTRRDRLAINGGSNGGLLVGASLAQHPELFGAAVPEVGVLDLLRYHRFTIGWAWTSDYGDPDDPAQYAWVRAYSPLHNLVEGHDYPATLVVTGDHDDRVVPGHSFKFAAALQHAQGGIAPILLRVETSAGHGMGKPTEKLIAERTDVLAFIEAALGIAPLRAERERR